MASRIDSTDRVEDLRIHRLVRLAYNLRSTWEPRAAAVFDALAPDVWEASRNPAAVLRAAQPYANRLLAEHAASIDAAATDLEQYLEHPVVDPPHKSRRIAYLSPEFAVAKCLPTYSGGLGVLAGDHLKAASDLALPVIGVGLLYRFGYFQQDLDVCGRQIERYDQLDPTTLPLRPVLLGERRRCRIRIPFPDRQVRARAWRADVGRTRLYLLDTDLPENREDDRLITGHLYGGDEDTRLRQEILLGIGGARLLRELQTAGLEAEISGFHLNEGHSALLIFELARERLAVGSARTLEEAVWQVAPNIAFTTHTAESTAHDVFSRSLFDDYLEPYARECGLSTAELIRLGRLHPEDAAEPFCTTVLALRGAARRNAVSRLHATASRATWHGVGVGTHNRTPAAEMDTIANGVHGPTWVGPEMSALYDSVLGRVWRVSARQQFTWSPLQNMPRVALWTARLAQRARLMRYAHIDGSAEHMLLIGFARRFTTYKRVSLLLEDASRLASLLTGNPQRPAAIIFAGKAHPRDNPAKLLVERVVQASNDPRFGGRILFLPDYDVELARLLVQGADVWLNTPRRGHEASGTSGMKAALNGALQVSELDGWWDEAYQPDLGWALGTDVDRDLSDPERDALEASELLDILERQVIPCFYATDRVGLPSGWLDKVVRSIVSIAPEYSAERMVADYATRVYCSSVFGAVQAMSHI